MNEVELAIIGQGPAGLSAAIYTSRAGVRTLVLGCDPKVAGNYEINNYFGFPETVSGKELVARGVAQAKQFGAEMSCEKVLSIHGKDDGRFIVRTEKSEITTCGIILATGVSRKKPAIKNLDKYEGRGVSYCVSCDGYFFRGRSVFVLGEGNFAANQAVELTGYTGSVRICTNGESPDFDSEFTHKLAELTIPVVTLSIDHLEGDMNLKRIIFTDGSAADAEGLFLALGDASSADFARSLGIAARGIFIDVDREQRTNVPGIFAAGDCTGGFLQISVAVGEGATASRSAISYIKEFCRK